MNDNTDYKKLYEDLKSKFDAIEFEKEKEEVLKKTHIDNYLNNTCDGEEYQQWLKEKKYLMFIHEMRLESDFDCLQDLINRKSFEYMCKILDSILEDSIEEEEKENDWKQRNYDKGFITAK